MPTTPAPGLPSAPAPGEGERLNALSFDIEDWFHIVGIPAYEDPATWPTSPTLAHRYTRQVLRSLDARGVRATFFMLGWLAETHPEIVPEILAAGHEVGLHSHFHRRVDQLTPEAFRDDLRRNLDVLAAQGATDVRGFRAPSFSITPGAEWAFDVLLDVGLRYDASLFPARRGHGGYPCERAPHVRTAPSGRALPELPMSVLRVGPLNVPFTGGGYFRLYPEAAIVAGIRRLHAEGLPAVVYLHPRDFAPDVPRIAMPPHRAFKCYVGMGSTQRKLERILDEFRFDTCARVLGVDA